MGKFKTFPFIFSMESENHLEIFKMIKSSEHGLWLKPLDERQDNYDIIRIKHQDGSKFELRFCFIRFAKISKGEIAICFPEHSQPSYHFLSDLVYIKTVERSFSEDGKTVLKTITKIYEYEEE